MRSTENIEKLVKNLDLEIDTNVQTDQEILDELLETQTKSMKQRSAYTLPNIRRFIMKSPIFKFAAAAAIILVVLGLFELTGTENISGVVWADVARKVEGSQGMICRIRGTNSASLEGDNGPDYTMEYSSATQKRTDGYKDGQIIRSFYQDFENGKGVAVFHSNKHFIRENLSDNPGAKSQQDMMDPRHLVKKILACEHKELGRKNIDGVLCVGLETTDPAYMGSNRELFNRLDLQMQLWVNAETQYLVRFESKITAEADGEVISLEYVVDQFQWNVKLDPNIFVPNIPPDYEQM